VSKGQSFLFEIERGSRWVVEIERVHCIPQNISHKLGYLHHRKEQKYICTRKFNKNIFDKVFISRAMCILKQRDLAISVSGMVLFGVFFVIFCQ